MRQSSQLHDFYKDIHYWIERGFISRRYSKKVGLCSNLKAYILDQNLPYIESKALQKELYTQFIQAGLSSILPFNLTPGTCNYTDEDNKYTNPQRLKWIKEHAQS